MKETRISDNCPSCGKLELYPTGALTNWTEVLKDIVGPGTLTGILKKSLNEFRLSYKTFEGKAKPSHTYYTCKSCRAKVAACSHCWHLFIVNGQIKNRTELKCPNCSKEFYIKLS